jgi:hypothetical protein
LQDLPKDCEAKEESKGERTWRLETKKRKKRSVIAESRRITREMGRCGWQKWCNIGISLPLSAPIDVTDVEKLTTPESMCKHSRVRLAGKTPQNNTNSIVW